MAAKKKAVGKKKLGSARKGRASKPTKADTVDVKIGGKQIESLLIGNMPPIKDLLYHAAQIAGYQASAKTAQGKVTAAKKRAREAGVDLSAVALAMGYERADPLELATELRQLAAIMKAKDMPIQLQLVEPKFGSIEEQAKVEGWNDGKAARTPNTSRWQEGAPGYVEYMRRWNDAQKDNMENGAGASAENDNGED